jgi:hypothetical protein
VLPNPGEGAGDPPRDSRWVTGLLARTHPKWFALLLAGCLLGVTGLFGGLAEADPVIDRVAVGEQVDAGPWKITVNSVRVSGKLTGLTLERPQDRWVIVVATVDVAEPTPAYLLSDAVALHGVPGIADVLPGTVGHPRPELMLARDGSVLLRLDPGMPERVGFFWEQPQARPAPATADVLVMGLTYRKSALSRIWGWLDPHPVGRLTTRVDDRRSA